jgi:hypothetical protein
MVFKLTKQEDVRREELCVKILEARAVLDEVINQNTAIIEDCYSAMNAAIADYNEVVSGAQGFFEDIHNERADEFDDKSERWQDGERGDAARSWLEAIGSARDDLEPIDDYVFVAPDVDFPDHATTIEDAPAEADF